MRRAGTTLLPSPASTRPGSLAIARTWSVPQALGFGLYATPDTDGRGSIVGPTHEAPTAAFPDLACDADAITRLQDRVQHLFGASIELESAWRGVRLARMSGRARRALSDVATLTALGSRGFLMAPLLAREWAASL